MRAALPIGWAPTAAGVYDAGGNLKDMLLVHGGDQAATKTHEESAATFAGCDEAVAYAHWLGAKDVRVVRYPSPRYLGRYTELMNMPICRSV